MTQTYPSIRFTNRAQNSQRPRSGVVAPNQRTQIPLLGVLVDVLELDRPERLLHTQVERHRVLDLRAALLAREHVVELREQGRLLLVAHVDAEVLGHTHQMPQPPYQPTGTTTEVAA